MSHMETLRSNLRLVIEALDTTAHGLSCAIREHDMVTSPDKGQWFSTSYIGQVVRGDIRSSQTNTVAVMADYLGCAPQWLLYGCGRQPDCLREGDA